MPTPTPIVVDGGATDADAFFAAPTAAEASAGRVAPIDALRAALSQPVQSEPITLKVPGRPGISVRFSTSTSQEQIKAWRKRAESKKRPRPGQEPDVDELLFCMLVIANQAEAVVMNGLDAHGDDDMPLTFRHRSLWEMVGAVEPSDAVRKFYGNDPHVLATANAVMEAAGFGDDVEEEDPTTA